MKAKEIGLRILVEVSRFLLGITFIFSGFVKMVDPLGTAYKIQDYFIAFGLDSLDFMSLPLSIFQCVVEFAVGVFLFLGIYRKWNTRVALLIMLFMTPLTLYLAIANPVSDCGCFGDAWKITNWETFFKNVVLLAASVITVIYNQKIFNFYTGKFYWLIGVWVIFFSTAFSVYSYYAEPIIDFRPYKIGANLPELMSVEEGKGDVYENVFIYEKDGVKKEFNEDNYPWQDTSWIFVDRINKLIKEGQKPIITDFEIERLYFNPEKTDFEGIENITNEVLVEDDNYVFLMIAYSLDDMRETYLSRFVDVNNYAVEHHYNFYCLTSSTKDQIIDWEGEYANNFKFCLTDERTLKTMMRSNPGLMLLKNGVIINKWTGGEVPSEGELTRPLNELSYGQMPDADAESDIKLFATVLILIIPLLLIKILDFIIYNRRKYIPEEDKN